MIHASLTGSLLEVENEKFLSKQKTPTVGRRGKVSIFSRKSRKRMLKQVAKLNVPESAYFVTLTFNDESAPLTGESAKNALRAFFERVRRQWPKSSGLWRMEEKIRRSGRWQGLSVPHFHLLLFNLGKIGDSVGSAELYQLWIHFSWSAVLGTFHARTDVQKIENSRGAMLYTAKYAAKVEPSQQALVYRPYLHEPRRQWGFFNRSYLPLYPTITKTLKRRSKAYYDFKRAVRRHKPKIVPSSEYSNFSLFTDDGERWLRYLDHLIE